MSVTRLKRKHRKNIARANNEVKKIKDLLRTPVLKNVDLDELKSRFGQSAPATEKKAADQPAAQQEGLFSKVAHAASAAADAVKHAASDAAEAVAHSSVVETVKHAAGNAVEAVQEAAHNLVEGAKHVIAEQQPASEPTTQNAAATNQTGTSGFDEAEAVTKPVNEDGQEGEHPKPEIQL